MTEWTTSDTCTYRAIPAELQDRPVLAFDLDSTLIKADASVRGRIRVARTATDWEPAFWADKMTARLRAAFDADPKPVIVVFTNQSGAGADTASDRIDGIIKKLLPGEQACGGIALGQSGKLRKPEIGMWWLVVGRQPRSDDLYVGDAAGRPGDFAASDRLFAENLGIKFMTESQFFLDDTSALPALPARPSARYLTDEPRVLPESVAAAPLVLLHGPPAAGKSTLCEKLLPDHEVASNDIHKTAKKAVSFAAAALRGGKAVVVDNTHANAKSREPYIALARELGVPIVAVMLVPPKEAAVHFNIYRGRTGGRRVPAMAIGRFYSDKIYEPPTVEEGFSEVAAIDWRLPRADFDGDSLVVFDMFSA